jgi:CDGSH-type Zn-finger protein
LSYGTSNHTVWIEDGEEVFPCRCGQTHRGMYAETDWIRHNHDHGPELTSMHDLDPEVFDANHLICSCGKDFFVVRRADS